MVPGAGDYAPGDLLDPSRLLFGQQGPGVAMSMMADDVGPGLFLVQLLEGADPDGDDVGRSFGVTFEDASLVPGSLGARPARRGRDPGGRSHATTPRLRQASRDGVRFEG